MRRCPGRERAGMPLAPLGLFRLRNLAISNVVGVLSAAAMFAWFFLSGPLPPARPGLQPARGRARLPAGQPRDDGVLDRNLGAARHALRHQAPTRGRPWRGGARAPALQAGPVDGNFVVDVLPSMILLGLGAGIAFNPVLLAAMGDVKPSDAARASSVVNTSFMMVGALGLAVLGERRGLANRESGSLGRRSARGAHGRLPRSVPHRRALRGRGRVHRRRLPPAEGHAGARARGSGRSAGRRRGRQWSAAAMSSRPSEGLRR
jgi:hypothetical protein